MATADTKERKLRLEIPSHTDEASFKEHFKEIQPDQPGAVAPGTPKNPDSLSFALHKWREQAEGDTEETVDNREERNRWRNFLKHTQFLELKLQTVSKLEEYIQAIFSEQNDNTNLASNNFKKLQETINHIEDNIGVMATNSAMYTTPGFYKCQYSYDGSIDNDVNVFLKNFELYLLSRSIDKTKSEDTAFAQLVLCLTDSAKNYIESLDESEYKSLKTGEQLGGAEKLDYEKLKNLLRKRFESVKSEGDHMTSLLQIKQAISEPISLFVKRFMNLSSKVKLNNEEKVQNSQLISIFINALTPKLRFELMKTVDSLDSLQACEKMAKRLEPLMTSQLERNEIIYNEEEAEEEDIYFAEGNSKIDKYRKNQKRISKYPNKYTHNIDNKALSQKIIEDNEQKTPDKITYQQTQNPSYKQNNQITPYNKQNNPYNNNNNQFNNPYNNNNNQFNYQMLRTPYNFRPMQYHDYQTPYYNNYQHKKPFQRPFFNNYQRFLVNPPRMVTFSNYKPRIKENRDAPRRLVKYNSYPKSPNTIQYFSPIYGQTNKRPNMYSINLAENNIDSSQLILQDDYENAQFEMEPNETIIETIDPFEPNYTHIFEEGEENFINNIEEDTENALPKMPETLQKESKN